MGFNEALTQKLVEGICTNVPLHHPSPTDESMIFMI